MAFCVALMSAGIIAGRCTPLPAVAVVSAALLLSCAASASLGRRPSRLFILGLAFLIMGAVHMSADVRGIQESVTPALARSKARVSVVGRALSNPVSAGSSSWFYLEASTLECGSATYECKERLLATADSSCVKGVFPGVRLRVRGSLTSGRSDEGRLRDRGAAAFLEVVSHGVDVVEHSADAVSLIVERARSVFSRSYRRMFSRDVAGLMEGVTLSKLDGIDDQTLENLNGCGLSHIVAVSGLNVSSMAAAVLALTALLGVGRRGQYLGACAAGVVVLALADFRPSASRACLMGALGSAGTLRGRKYDAVAGLSLAAVLILSLNPRALFDGGFQLSFAATAGIVLFMKRRARHTAAGAVLAVCAGAQLGVLPILLLKGDGVPVTALAANLLVVPVVGVLLITAWASAILHMVAGPAGSAVGTVPDLIARYVMRVASVLGHVPAAAARGPRWQVAALCLYVFALIMFIRTERPSIKIPAAAAALLAVVSVLAPGLPVIGPPSRDRIVMIDVGQGDAALIQDRTGASVLVDGGPDSELIVEKLQRMGVRKLDVVIATHPHSDHVEGLVGVIERFPIGVVVDSGLDPRECEPHRRLIDRVRARGIRNIEAREGWVITVSDVTDIEVLYPPPDLDTARREVNDCSLVVMVRIAGARALMCADVEAEGQRTLTALHPDLECDVLKVPHQGARDAVSEELMSAANPSLAVISVGRDNEYGHPSRRCLDLLTKNGIRTARTDEDGDVEINVVNGRIALGEDGR